MHKFSYVKNLKIGLCFIIHGAFLMAQSVKNLPAKQETLVWLLGLEDPLEKGEATTPVNLGFLCGSAGRESPTIWETWVWSLAWEDPLGKGKATHSSILSWKIPWTVQSIGSQRVRHDCVIFTSLYNWWTVII